MANHPIQSSGPISLRDIELEFNQPDGSTVSLTDAKNGVYGAINLAAIPNPVTGNNSVTGQPKDGLHVSDWYGYNHNFVQPMNFGTGFDLTMSSLVIQPDGKIIVGGSCNTYNGSSAGSIARLNPDGSKDTAFTTAGGVGFDGSVVTLALQSDNKIMAGGFFGNYNSVARRKAIRLNTDGSADTAHYTNMGSAFNLEVDQLAIQSDGKTVCVGNFTQFNSTPFRNGLIRLNTDGSEDAAFKTNIGNGVSPGALTGGIVYSVIIQQFDQKILIGGGFTTFKGSFTRNKIIRLNPDGTEDSAFYANLGSAFNGTVNALAWQSDGRILVGGAFTTLNGVTRNNLVRLNGDGTVDTAFYTNLGSAFNGNVENITIQNSDGKILVGGSFTTFNGVTRSYLIRLNPDGTLDTTFSTNLGTGFNNNVICMAVQTSGRIIVVGAFTAVNGVTRNKICQLDTNGTPLA